jgi:aspartate aminotransferase
MATSYLYFKDQDERYTRGYALLESSSQEGFSDSVELPLLDEAIAAIQKAVEKVKSL